MKHFFTLLFFAALTSSSFAQSPNWLWVGGTGLSGFQYGNDISYSPTSGDIYSSGRLTSGTSTLGGKSVFSPGTLAYNGRMDKSGTFSWANVYAFGSFDYLFAFYRDKKDNLYSTGCVNSSSFWANRVTAAGGQTWAANNSTGGTQGTAIAADTMGNIYVAGGFNSPSTFGTTTLNSSGGADIFLVKYNAAGNVVWAKSYGGAGSDMVKGMETDAAGNLYFAGGYTGTPTFGSTTLPAATGYGNFYITKMDSSGNPIWVSTASSAGPISSPDNACDIAIDDCGNLYVASTFQNIGTFGIFSFNSSGGYDPFIAKLGPSGNWEWVKTIVGQSSRDEAVGIAIDKDHDVYVSGIFTGTIMIDTMQRTSAGGTGIFVTKLANSTGDFMWAQVAGGPTDDNSGGLTVDDQKFVYLTGVFTNTANFGSLSVTAGSSWPNNDLFIAKLDTVSTPHITPSPLPLYCPGSTSQLSYAVTGNFNTGNVFTAQLSDANGSFSAATTIGAVSSTGSGTITITIPPGSSVGARYVIRVTSSSPAYSSFEYCQFIAIGNTLAVTASGDTSVCGGTPVPISALGGVTYSWSPTTVTCATCASTQANPTISTTYTVTATSGACSAIDTVVVQISNSAIAGLVSAPNDTLCEGTTGSVTSAGITGSPIQWQESTDGVNFTNISGATGGGYNTNPLLQTTYYRVIVGSGFCVDTSTAYRLFVPPALIAAYTETVAGLQVSFDPSTSTGNITFYSWDFGDGATSTQQYPTHIYTKDTIYNVCLTIYDGSNCSFTYCRDVATSADPGGGIASLDAQSNWVVYPNPVGDRLFISSKLHGSLLNGVELYDVLGRLVYSNGQMSANNPVTVDVSGLAKGLYCLKLKTSQGDFMQKMVKE